MSQWNWEVLWWKLTLTFFLQSMWSSTQPYGFWDLLVLQGSSFKSVTTQPTAALWIGISKKAKNKSRWGWIWAIEPVRHWWSEPAEWGEQAWVPLPIERWGEKPKKQKHASSEWAVCSPAEWGHLSTPLRLPLMSAALSVSPIELQPHATCLGEALRKKTEKES